MGSVCALAIFAHTQSISRLRYDALHSLHASFFVGFTSVFVVFYKVFMNKKTSGDPLVFPIPIDPQAFYQVLY